MSCKFKSSELDVTVLRLQNVYGPGQSFQNAYTGLISIFTQRLLNNNSIELYEEGSPGRDFVYVEDVADAIINCIYSRENLLKRLLILDQVRFLR